MSFIGGGSGTGAGGELSVAEEALISALNSLATTSAGEFMQKSGAAAFTNAAPGAVSTITVAAETTDTSCSVLFVTDVSGALQPKTNTNLTFNSNTGVFTSASLVATTADINAGTIDNTTIGATTATTIVGTTITANTGFVPDVNDGAYLGQSGTGFSDLFLASGAVINFDAGASTITHSANTLTIGGSGATALALGANNLTMTGSLGATGAGKLTKIWSVDAEFTNLPTINGGTLATALSLSSYATLASPTFTGTVTLPTVQLGEASIKLDDTLSGDETWSGITTSGLSGVTTLAIGDLIYLNADDSRWELVDANESDGYDKQLGIALTAAADGAASEILLFGKVRSAAFPAFTVGSPLYMSETAGDVTHTAPVTANAANRIVGIALTAEDLFFNPSNDYIVHT